MGEVEIVGLDVGFNWLGDEMVDGEILLEAVSD